MSKSTAHLSVVAAAADVVAPDIDAKPKRKRKQRRTFGRVEPLPSGNYRARYWHLGQQHAAPHTFTTVRAADLWLASEQTRIDGGAWLPPSARPSDGAKVTTVTEHLRDVIAQRDKPRTRQEYERMLEKYIAPTALGRLPLAAVTLADVKLWYRDLTPGKPTQKARAYSLVSLGFNTAVKEKMVPENPCQIDGATKVRRKSRTRIASPAELDVIREQLPEQWRLLVDLGGWTGLRFGEAIELRRGDFDLDRGVISVDRAVARVKSESGDVAEVRDQAHREVVLKRQTFVVDTPKAESMRDVYVPQTVVERIREHLDAHVGPRRDALLFHAVGEPTRHLSVSTFRNHWVKAVKAAGRTDLRFHDLRHTAGTRATQQGATTREVMAFLGHATNSAAMRYQHAEDSRLADLAKRLDGVARGE